VRIFRFLSSPHSLPLHLSFLACFVLDIYSVYATANRTHHAPLVAIPESEPQPCRALHPDAFPYGFRRELRQLRGPGVFLQYRCALYLGSLRTHWCTIHFFLPPTFLWPSLALISSASAQFSLHFLRATQAGLRRANSFPFTCFPCVLCAIARRHAMRNCPPSCLTSHVPPGPFPFHFVTILFPLRWRSYAIRCRWGHDACYASSDGTCNETGWPMRGKKEREVAAGTRIPSHGALVQPHPSPPAATRLSTFSLYFHSRSWFGLGRRGAAHPDPAAARSACALVSSSRLVFAHSNPFYDLPFSFFPFPALVLCVCAHVLIATRRSTSSCCLRIGLGDAGNHRRLRLARCAGF
jgi:hypothetical protein